MNIQHLKYIIEIADCRSVTKASKKLYVSQPYLSKVISDLESKLKKKIFIRYNSGLELTTFGQKVYILAQSIIDQMNQLDNLGKEQPYESCVSKLSLSVGNFLMTSSVITDYFSSDHISKSYLDFCETTIQGCIKNVEDNTSEFAIIVVDDFQKALLATVSDRKGLKYIRLDEGDLYYHIHHKHDLTIKNKIDIEKLIRYPFVRLKTDEYTALSRKKFKEEYPDIDVYKCITANNIPSCLNIIKNTDAFMLGNKWQISELEKKGITSIRFSSSDHKNHLMILKREMVPFSEEARRFLNIFISSYGLEVT